MKRIPLSAAPRGYENPFRAITHIGDPDMLYDAASEKYYLYCTGGRCNCWSSSDLQTFFAHGDGYQTTERSFGTQNYWAPEVKAHGGKYYMVYSAARILENGQKRHSIGIAVAAKPEGPFVDLYDHPLFAPDYSVIDADLFFDDDGRIYLYYSRDNSENFIDGKRVSQSFGVEVKPDFSGVIGTPVLLTTPDAPWELRSGSVIWNEGPCVFKRNGIYYILYTANYYASPEYAVGYATSDQPLGKYTKAAHNPIVQGDGVYTSGTGHCNVISSPDGRELYMIYHSHTDVKNTRNPVANRTPCLDRMHFDADGKLTVEGPTVTRQPLPSGTNGTRKVAAQPNADGRIEFCFDRPVRLDSLFVYGKGGAVYAQLDGDGDTEAVRLGEGHPNAPAVLGFDDCTAAVVRLIPTAGATLLHAEAVIWE